MSPARCMHTDVGWNCNQRDLHEGGLHHRLLKERLRFKAVALRVDDVWYLLYVIEQEPSVERSANAPRPFFLAAQQGFGMRSINHILSVLF